MILSISNAVLQSVNFINFVVNDVVKLYYACFQCFSVRFGRSQLLFYVPVLDFICRTSNSVIRVLNSIIRVSNLDLLNPGH